jgi:hypothetical protein
LMISAAVLCHWLVLSHVLYTNIVA